MIGRNRQVDDDVVLAHVQQLFELCLVHMCMCVGMSCKPPFCGQERCGVGLCTSVLLESCACCVCAHTFGLMSIHVYTGIMCLLCVSTCMRMSLVITCQ